MTFGETYNESLGLRQWAALNVLIWSEKNRTRSQLGRERETGVGGETERIVCDLHAENISGSLEHMKLF